MKYEAHSVNGRAAHRNHGNQEGYGGPAQSAYGPQVLRQKCPPAQRPIRKTAGPPRLRTAIAQRDDGGP